MRVISILLLLAAVSAGYVRADSTVVFNEVMYHPATDESAMEWVELHNQMSVDMDISGWSLTDAIGFTFPEGTVIKGGGYLVVARSPSTLAALTGLANVVGPFTGRLSNSGEEIDLRNNSDRLMDQVTYDVDGEWPVGADGAGASLAKRHVDLASELAENWGLSLQVGGTPGRVNFPVRRTVRVTTRSGLVPIDQEWSYEASGSDLGVAWREPGFDDSGWGSGPALLGVESAGLAEPLLTTLALGPTTFYFRTRFEFSGDPLEAALSVTHIVDDGMVVYLNGAEVWRVGVPGGELSSGTFASRAVGDASYEGPFSIPNGSLVEGTNVIAVEVHQTSAGSSDVVFGLALDEVMTFERLGPDYEIPDGLVSYWDFDGVGGVWPDLAGGNSGVGGSGVVSVSGLTGTGAVLFDGASNAFVNVGSGAANSFSVRGGIAIEALMIPDWDGTGSATVFRKEEIVSAGGALISYWSFDESSSGTGVVMDLVGGNNGSFIGSARRTAGLVGVGAGLFNNLGADGVNVGAGVNNAFSTTTGISIFALIRPTWSGGGGDYDEIFRKEDGGNRILLSFQNDANNGGANPPVAPGPVLSFGLNVGGYGELDMPLDGLSGRPTLAQLKDGGVHSVVATYDSGTGLKAIYIDGSLRHSVTLSGPVSSGGGTSAVIGNTSTAGGEPFSGTIDEVAIWRVGLSAGQVLALHNGESPLTVEQGNEAQSTRILFAFQNDGGNGDALPPVAAGPVLSFGLNVGGEYSELDMPLDGLAGRPSLAQLQDGLAHHVVAVYDGATGVKAIHVDGTLRYSTTLSGNVTSGGSADAIIGNSVEQGDKPFDGVLDEVAFWDRALLSQEIQAHVDAAGAGRSYFSSGTPVVRTTLAFNELSSATNGAFWLEIINHGSEVVELEGHLIERGGGGSSGRYLFPASTLGAGDRLQVTETVLGFRPLVGNRLSLLTPGGGAVLDAVVVEGLGRARHPEVTGRWLYPDVSTPGGPNSVQFRDEIVINEIMYDHLSLPAQEATFGPTNLLITITNEWSYNQEGVDLGTGWRGVGFDDSGWPVGAALLYATPSSLAAPKNTLLDLRDALGQRKTTFYFRTRFVYEGDPAGVVLKVHPLIDDGAVFYLNGEEVLRLNMPPGEVNYLTTANVNVGIPTFTGPFDIDTSPLVAGTNVLAVELHQVSPFSGDVVFGMELLAPASLVPALPFRESPESWLELHNRSSETVDLAGWSLDSGIEFVFPVGTMMGPGGYLVIAKDPAVLRALYPALTILGPFDRRLSRSSDHIVLRDGRGNPADEVRYFDGGRWPELANGGGSSLELRDPWADNSAGEAWGASDEGSRAQWQTVTYRGVAVGTVSPPAVYNELVLGLLDAGEVLLDDIRVVELPDTTAAQLIQNSTFEGGLDKWRIIGNHSGSVVTDPDDGGNSVLRLVATGATEHQHNHAETTLKNGASFVSVVNGREYEVSFRARWMGGSRLLNTRLWFNRLPRTTRLEVPLLNGTPGAANSRVESNIGPTFRGLKHEPVVPAGGVPVEVSVALSDPQGVALATVYWSADGGAWGSAPMVAQGGGRYGGSVPGFSDGTTVQFYVEARDGQGAVAFAPAAGPESRALYKVEDGQAMLSLAHNVRIVMTPDDTELLFANTNLMSNGRLGATVIYDEREVFYDVGVRLKGSEHGRPDDNRLGFNIAFQPDHLFRGVHPSVAIDRSGGWRFGTTFGQDEILIKHIITRVGRMPGTYEDLIRVIAPRSTYTGSAMLQMARYGDIFLNSQYRNGGDGTTFEYELFYGLSQTTGGPEGLKIPQEGGVAGVAMGDMGDDKESYRLPFIIKNNREADDYRKLMAANKVLGMPAGAQFHAEAARELDVDEWLRAYAVSSLVGPADNYGGDNAQHNMYLYTRPDPEDKTQFFVFDADFAFIRPPTSPVAANTHLLKFLTLPANARLYHGHLLDMMDTTYNTGYMAYWTDHYDDFLPGQNFSSILSYIGQREAYVRGQLPASVAFAITTNNGQDFSVGTTSVLIGGTAWIDVKTVRLGNRPELLEVAWVGASTWEARVPLILGTNLLVFEGVGFQGQVVASGSISVMTTAIGGGQDSDGDGIPDAWEMLYGLDPLLSNGGMDADGDGVSDFDEYVSGTDPTDGNRFLKVEAMLADAGMVRLTFRAMAGRSYTIESRAEAGSGLWGAVAQVAAEGGARDVEVLDAVVGGEGRVYRLVTPGE